MFKTGFNMKDTVDSFKIDIAALGELLIDFTCDGIGEGGYPTLTAHPGGAPANFLAAAAKYGCKTALISKVGSDSFGRLLTATLASAGISTRAVVQDASVFTTLAFVTIDGAGEREFSFARKPGADLMLRTDEVDFGVIDSARIFHFGTLSLTGEPARAATRDAVEYARRSGKLISFDPNLRLPLWDSPDSAAEQMLWGLARADVIKISDGEVDFLWGLEPEDGARKILDEFGAKLVFVTCGASGCVFANRYGAGRAPSPAVHPVDTTGAGDIFGGAALALLLRSGKAAQELTLPELRGIAAIACAAASLSTEKKGGIESIPDEAAALARVAI